MSLKRKLVDMCILPILIYEAQTWSLTETQKSKLKIYQRAIQRSILEIKLDRPYKKLNPALQNWHCRCRQKTVKLKWDWAGHICRMHPNRWVKIVTNFIGSHTTFDVAEVGLDDDGETT